MPYIKPEIRVRLDPEIQALVNKIRTQDFASRDFAGILNYSCTRLAVLLIQALFGRLSYWVIAETTGAFHNVAEEFYRRLAGPYEDRKIEENGDVYGELL